MNVVVSLPRGSCRLDALKVSYSIISCLRRRREIASFIFPKNGWWCVEGIEACKAESALSVPLARLQKKDPNRTIQLLCTCDRKTLLRASMTLGRLLDNLDFLHFSLFCGGREPREAFTSMRCNGRRCGEAVPTLYSQARGGRPGPSLVSPTQANGVQTANDLTPASPDQANDERPPSDPTPASNCATDDVRLVRGVSDLTYVATTHSNGQTGGCLETPASHDEASGVKAASETTPTHRDKPCGVQEVSVMTTPASNNEDDTMKETNDKEPDSTKLVLRRRERRRPITQRPRRHAQRRAAAPPEERAVTYRWVDAFLDGTAICAMAVSGILVYCTSW